MKSRRFFIKSIISLPTLLYINHKVLAKNTVKSVLLNQCSIAGFQYYQGKELLRTLVENEPLELIAEPGNQYDKFAVEVYYQTKKLGYIPRKENKHISRILRAGGKLNARVHAVDTTKKSWDTLIVSVFMQV